MATKRSVNPSTIRFKKLFDLTMQVCTVDPPVDYISIVQRKTKRWNVLLDIWQKNTKKYGSVFLFNPLIHIFYGEIGAVRSKKVNVLLQAIEEALLNDNEAFNQWIMTKEFARAYHYATQRAHQLNVYWDFQHAWGIERLLQGKTITSLPKHSRERDFDFLNPRYIAGRMQFLDDFKTSICKLLPEAVSWSYKQWMDYNHVCKAFQLKYDIDLSASSDQLNSVYHLMKYNVDNHFYVDFDDILNAPLNYAIYKAIHPTNTEECLWKLFQQVLSAYELYDQVEELGDSWMFQIVFGWAQDKCHPYHSTVKRIVFDMIMKYNLSPIPGF